jgi:hypothetical protein
VGLKVSLAGMLDIHPSIILLLADPYSSAPKLREIVKTVASEQSWPEGALERLGDIVGRSRQHTTLRNHIAHSRWREGTRSSSIKPIGLKMKNDRAAYFGHLDDERDWTSQENRHCAKQLRSLCDEIIKFNDDYGLTDRIAKNLPRAKWRRKAKD